MQQDEEFGDFKKALTSPVCPYCTAAISTHQLLQPGHCGAEPCFLAHISRGVQAQKDQREQDYIERQNSAKEGKASAIATAAFHLNCDTDDLLIAVVPFQNNPVEPLPPAHREAFRQHLEKIVEEAFALGSSALENAEISPNSSAEHSIIDAACSTCQGFCCARGGGENHAFLTVKTILGYLSQNQELLQEDVIAHYTDALPQASVRAACVFQSDQGCTLERTSRAPLCNTFYCHDLHAMHDLTQGRSDVRMAIIGVQDDTPAKVSAFSEIAGQICIDPT
ncbi:MULTISPECIES: hypothetical protein [Falsihalocynthiibacter]|uniref:hypothetical protein n=1 Tax=Falsihalocynthiibacter TaxID=2854182 RepID=UPI003002EC02